MEKALIKSLQIKGIETMHRLHIEIRGLTASFRVPHMFKYHRSLPLPPYTAIVGMFGAAIGKDMSTAQEIFKSLGLRVGVAGNFSGGCNDTWRVLTSKPIHDSRSKEEKKKSDLLHFLNRDVVERQILFMPRYHIVFYGNESAVRLCERAFRCPVYPLSLGRPDDLANVLVHDVFEYELEDLHVLRNTVVTDVPAATVDENRFDIDDPEDPGPIILLYRLPVQFVFVNGFPYHRTAIDFKDFTFIGDGEVTLKEPVKGFKIKSGSKERPLSIPILEI